jgi:hydrogenase-4 component B
MTPLLLALIILLGSGLLAALAGRRPSLASAFGAGGAVLASIVGLVPVAGALAGGPAATAVFPWAMPGGSFAFRLDGLSAVFLLPLLLLTAVAAIFGAGYLRHGEHADRTGPAWLLYNVLTASMIGVCTASNALFFLFAWECMSLASFFLVAFEAEKESVRRAAWTYLVATHLGTAFLLALFLVLARAAGSFEFAAFAGVLDSRAAGACVLLAFVGFGTKAGVVPFHVWLPEAHPAAPSHVSAVLSGVMVKTGLYGLFRVLGLLGAPEPWWGWLLLGFGAAGALAGVAFALAQQDLKRMLAYSTVENVGLILMGAGLGFTGIAYDRPALAALGFAAAFLHTINHALMKGLLFLAAGTVAQATGTRNMDRLGGLLKLLPRTGYAFLIGAAAIAGVPLLNGFLGEFALLLGTLRGMLKAGPELALPLAAALVVLALTAGLAVAAFTRAAGLVFLGTPRSPEAGRAREAGPLMTLPLLALAAACLVLGLNGHRLLQAVTPAVSTFTADSPRTLANLAAGFARIGEVGAAALILLLAAGALRAWLLRGRSVRSAGTWDCGYVAPTARMQYTASSFAQPLVDLLGPLTRTRKQIELPAELFPAGGTLATHTPDPGREHLFDPLFAATRALFARFHFIQTGRIHLYVAYVVFTLIALLIWKS